MPVLRRVERALHGRGIAAAEPSALGARRRQPGREKILAAAERLFAERGFDAVSTKELAAAAGLTIGALYHHFDSKDAVYRAALRAAFAKLPAAPEPSPGDHRDPAAELHRLVAWFSATIAAPSDVASLLRRELLEPHLGQPVTEIAIFEAPLHRFVALMRELAPEADPEFAKAAIASLSFGLTALKGLRRTVPDDDAPPDTDAVARQVTDLVLRGLGPSPPGAR